jgi:hypothetical protein
MFQLSLAGIKTKPILPGAKLIGHGDPTGICVGAVGCQLVYTTFS